MIKRSRTALVEAVAAQSRTAGRAGLRAAHTQVFEHLDPAGTRLTVLADRAGMTHQAMSELVAELVHNGYLERIPDPVDGRARLVRPTAQGRHELGRAAGYLRELHRRWQAELGPVPVEHVLRALDQLSRLCEADLRGDG
jgi:DNA-binding MarR family transcriptional regulator